MVVSKILRITSGLTIIMCPGYENWDLIPWRMEIMMLQASSI
jgi:hypothetical protein